MSLIYAQSSTATLGGAVMDQNGAAVPGAEITAMDPSTGLTRQATTTDDGSYTFPPLPPGTYIVRAQRDGFAPVEMSNVVLSTGDSQALNIELKVGAVGETITVQADAGQLQIQSESGERSDLVTKTQLKDLALNGRNVLGLLRTIPGITGNASNVSGPGGVDDFHINGTRGNQTEITIDGSSNVNTGSNNQLQVTINPDAVEEVKVLTSNYQAEYGKAAGGQIQFRTRSGGNQYHGGARFFRRHDSLNANGFFDNANGRPRQLYRYDSFGYDFSGPVVLPRFGEGGPVLFNGKSKLFFFYNQEFYQQLRPNNARNLRVPTAAERNGDFSQTTDGNGNRIFIGDPLKVGANGQRLPCSATNQTGCFTYQGRVNVIDPARFFRDGQATLNIYPLPNTTVGGLQYNYSSQISQEFPRREDIIRIDYNLSDRTRITGRYLNNPDRQDAPYGGFANVTFNFPLFDYVNRRDSFNAAFTLLHTFTPTLTNEFIFGPSRQLAISDAEDNLATRAARNITSPLLFSGALGSELIPTYTYGGITNQTFPTTAILPLPRLFDSHIYNFTDNLTKVAGNHIIKAGFFFQRGTFKGQGGQPTNSNINFTSDANNPLNTGHPFANALLGIYNTFQQADTALVSGSRYNNIETYVQDTWKVTRRLTLDLGLRLSYLPPQFDVEGRGAVFSPELFNAAHAPRLYTPVLVGTARRAVDPANRPVNLTATNTLPSAFIGLLVPGSGDSLNGLGLENNGYPRGGFDTRGLQIGPRLGFAIDLLGDGSTVVRGGFGISYDRLQYNVVPQVANPLTVRQPQLFYGQLSDLSSASGAIGPTGVQGYARDGKIPNVYSYSLGVQRNVGFGTVVDVAYVGTLGRHLVQSRNINAVPYYATFRRENQDPTLLRLDPTNPNREANLPQAYIDAGFNFSGQYALPANFLRPNRGYGAINFREFVGSSNYHALQASVKRRFTSGLTFGIAYTWSKTMVTGDEDFEGTNPYNTRAYNYRLADFDRTHVFVANYVYDLPRLSRFLGESPLVRALFDNYQLSGISSFGSGGPFELGFNINSVNAGQRITGSYDLAPALSFNGDPRQGAPDGMQLNPDAFVIPQVGNIGPYPRNYLRGPFNHNHDVSLFKNFPFGGENRSRYLQLRLEAFNIFNLVRLSGINSGVTLVVPSTNTADASGYTIGSAANGNAVIFNDYSRARITDNIRGLRPTDAGRIGGQFFGEYNNAGSPRILQLAVKLYF
ncbi:MAG: Plug and carboxypeptidase regulatory-like domain-containing protein [Acidobacteriota bacterium]|nr:Plug and carboxypeptidase regulatory-like domain-containing protein [Acidobacteriota bacterium]